MKELRSPGRILLVLPLLLLFACALSTVADAQGLPEFPVPAIHRTTVDVLGGMMRYPCPVECSALFSPKSLTWSWASCTISATT